MNVLLFEYLHADSQMFDEAAPSLQKEGRAMLQALCDDLSSLSEVSLSVACCPRAGEKIDAAATVALVSINGCGPKGVMGSLLETAHRFDLIVPVAPECDGLLYTVVSELRIAGHRVYSPGRNVIQIGSDKWQTFERLRRHGVPVIPTAMLTGSNPYTDSDCVVIKARDGVGCEGTRRLATERFRSAFTNTNNAAEALIVQPWISGASFSVGVFGRGPETSPLVCIPASQQIIWENDRPRYAGGCILPDCPDAAAMQSLARSAADAVGFNCGYMGIDIMQTPDGTCLVTEINPRFTTSYVGYRQATKDNLASLIVNPGGATDPVWEPQQVSFNVSR